jgi:hypothetical protein
LGRTDHDSVLDKKNRLLERSRFIKNGVENYKKRLNIALEVHVFMRDYEDLEQRINEKIKILSTDTDLRTLDSVQVAQKKLAELERDLKAINPKLKQLTDESNRLITNYEMTPTNKADNATRSEILADKVSYTERQWQSLEELLGNRKKKLDYDLAHQKFMVECRDLSSWIGDLSNRLQQQAEPSSLAEAETALNLHQERRTEIEGKRHRFLAFQDMARDLTAQSHAKSNAYPAEFNQETQKEIAKSTKEVAEAQQQLETKCSEKQKRLQESREYQEFSASWKQIENWAKQIEAPLCSADVGDSVLAVKSLLTKHDNIENSIKSQTAANAAFDALEQRGQDMIKLKYAQSEALLKLIAELQAKRKDLDRLCVNRRKQLEDSLMFQNFLLNYYDVIQWIKEKTASAIDKTYLDLTNLSTKIQRHTGFMLDLKKGGTKRVDDVHKEADNLLARHQSTAYSLSANSSQKIAEISEYIKDLDAQWNALKTAAETKRKCLDDAHKCVLFTRLCDDLIAWFDEVEAQLGVDDNGHDLSSCKMFLLRHQALARQIESQKEKLNEIDSYLANNRDNFMLSKMQESAEMVRQRYLDLQEPCTIRNENLEESLSLFAIVHDLDDSLLWMQEKQPVACMEELGSNLDETKKLYKKHSQLEQELAPQQALLQSVLKSAKQLIERKNYFFVKIGLI